MVFALALIAVGMAVVVGVPSGISPGAHEASAGGSAEESAREPDGGHESEPARERDAGEGQGKGEKALVGEAGERARASAELVQQNAYPAGFASTGAGLRARAATSALPEQLAAGDFRAQVSDVGARAQAGAAWDSVGPVGVVPSPSFPMAPVVAGRVNALVIDPHCGQPGNGCRLWLGASGGGIWRTPDAMADEPSWTFVSGDIPTNTIGTLTLDPNDATGNTIYAGTGDPNGFGNAGVGLYRSIDGGDNWSLVPGSRAYAMNRAIGGVAVQAGKPDVIVMGTSIAELGGGSVRGGSESPPNGPALGVYVTINGGGAFEHVLPTTSRAISPSFPSGGVVQLEFDPVTPSILYASVTGYGIYRLSGGVLTNIYTPSDPTDAGSRAAFTLIKRGAQVHMYVLDGGFSSGGQVFRTLDAQAVTPAGWTAISDPAITSNLYGANSLCAIMDGANLLSQCWYDMSITGTVSGNDDVVWVGGMVQYDELGTLSNGRAVVRSANADAVTSSVTWNDMTVGATTGSLVGSHPDQHAMILNPSDPDQAFLGSDGGLVRTDGGFSDASGGCSDPQRGLAGNALTRCEQLLSAIPAAVTGINSNLSTLEVVGVASANGGSGALLAGFQDNGTAINGGAAAWTGVAGGDGGPPAFDQSGPEIAYQQYYSGSLFVSYDSGALGSFFEIDQPMKTSGEAVSFYAPLLADPVTPGTVFSGWEHVWRSTDHGGTKAQLVADGCDGNPTGTCGDFEPMGPNLTDPALGDLDGGYVAALARGTGDINTLWAATSMGRVFVSKNATAPAASATFTRIDDDSAITPTRFPSSIQVDPTDPNHAWVAYAGYTANTPTTPGHLFEVRFNPGSGTSTWADRSYDLGDVPLRAMAYDPLLGDIYASGDWGVLRLPGGATAWMDAGNGMPRVASYALTIQPGERALYAATFGRGVYELALPDADPGPAPPAPMPAPTPAAGTPANSNAKALSARVLLPRSGRVTAGANGSFVLRLAPTSQSGNGTVTVTGALQPTSGRPTSTRLAQVRYRFTRNHATNVIVRLPAGSRRVVARAGRMNATAQVVMRSTAGESSATTARLVLQASPRLRANSR